MMQKAQEVIGVLLYPRLVTELIYPPDARLVGE